MPFPRERLLYSAIRRFVIRHIGCKIVSSKPAGIEEGRADLLGVRFVARGRSSRNLLADDSESVAVEVKSDATPFLRKIGQASAYRVFAHRVYLADWRPPREHFSPDELFMAHVLGVGLIAVSGSVRRPRCSEVVPAPHTLPVNHLRLEALRSGLRLAECTICRLLFKHGLETDLPAWNPHLAAVYPSKTPNQTTFRRYVCETCVAVLWGEQQKLDERLETLERADLVNPERRG